MKYFITLIVLIFMGSTYAQPNLKSPKQFLGYEIGSEYTRHHRVIDYFEYLAENSSRLQFSFYGKTNENRQLGYAVISSEDNLDKLENIRIDHLKQTGILKGDSNPEVAIVWMSYNVHGNETSGSEAAMQTAFELVSSGQDSLRNTVVIIDPCINPDGRDRYINWYKQVKATPYSPYQDANEHHEPWASGRPNHYLFDLNRDWMWATQIETQQRIGLYNQWMPHVHVDFHEQGINEPYYFAPAAEPYHEVITDFQREFQTKIGKQNAKIFDNTALEYFTRERFDLFYPSYGDTYPTYNGAIGMTYEQAGNGRAGLGINTDEGYELTLIDRIHHHVLTGLSTVKTASESAKLLNSEFKKYFQHNITEFDYYVLTGNSKKLKTLSKLFKLHDIRFEFSRQKNLKGTAVYGGGKKGFNAEHALVLPANQPKAKLLKVLFEAQPKLSTPLTYDITSWNIALAHGLNLYTVVGKIDTTPKQPIFMKPQVDEPIIGYITAWESMADARFLSDLLKHNVVVKATTKPLTIENKSYKRGSLIITKTNNKQPHLDSLVYALAQNNGIQLQTTSTGFSDSGTDFGSPDIKKINPQRIAVLRGDGVSTLSYGAIWYFFEQEIEYPIISISTQNFSKIDLSFYDVLILPDGRYSNTLNDNQLEILTNWISQGGKLIAVANAVSFFEDKESFNLEKIEHDDKSTSDLIPYSKRALERTKDFITGAIYKVKVDSTHPLGFGYDGYYHSLKTNTIAYQHLKKGYNVAYIDDSSKKVSGFAGENAAEKLKNTLVFGELPIGKGSVIYMIDDVFFRSFWENGKLFVANALFMVNNRSHKFR